MTFKKSVVTRVLNTPLKKSISKKKSQVIPYGVNW